VGDPKDVLARPGYVMISRSLAEKMGGVGNAVGKTFVRDANHGSPFTIGGVFEDIPENSHLRYDAVASLATMPEWSTTNWLGNDRYIAPRHRSQRARPRHPPDAGAQPGYGRPEESRGRLVVLHLSVAGHPQ